MDNHLLFFYGDQCPHCKKMEKLISEMEKDGPKVSRLEIWHNEENCKKMESLDCGDDPCGGVPFFINTKTNKTLCGEVTLNEIKDWANE